jgi:DNA-directed RNA polymerase subunit RPC12/RpoP
MADIKFSCGNCGQHISCDELWSGHQIQCPACHNNITVPHFQVAAQVDGVPQPPVPQSPAPNRPKLSAGLTQVPARSAPPAAIPQRRPPRPPKSKNSLLGYAVLAVVLLVVGVAAYNYLPALISQVKDTGSSLKSSGAARPGSASGGGPLGEVNEAMDASDALDGGGARSRPRPSATKVPAAVPGTNAPAKPTQPK